MRILIIKLGAIGDIVHTLPALAAMRSACPDADISWAAESRSAEILRGNPLIDRLIEIDTKELRGIRKIDQMLPALARQIRGLRGHRFDIAIDFQGLIKSAVIAKVSGAGERWGFSRPQLREPAGRLLLTDTVQVPIRSHVIRKNLKLAETALDTVFAEDSLEFPISTDNSHDREAEEIIQRSGSDFAILNPGGAWPTKLWPAARYGALADALWQRLRLTPVLATGPRESELAEAAAAHSTTGRMITAQPSLKGFYQLARSSRLYIGGDTGPTHIAMAAGAPIVGLFGPTEWWRNGSPHPDDICVERNDIGCRVNCHRRSCSNWICMDIDVETVLAAAVERLAREKNPHTSISPIRAS